ncbi:MAG: cell division protein FtsZ [Betaproteobacteria bacterium]|nr:cell division protein FtsZ [Betaproteobacteria bacterium]
MSFEMLDDEPAPEGAVIKVVGVGGAGGNAVNHMISRGVQGVEFIAMNTDKQALIKSGAAHIIQLGEAGLGAGANPEAGRDSARARELEIRAALEGANMVFLTAGMGKGTGTGASPVVASIAKDMGILTVGVVTKPFDFEGSRKMKVAEAGIDALVEHVDSLIVVLNQKLFEVMDEDASLQDAFKQADNVLHNAVAGIAEIINVPGLVNVDFADVRTVMAEQGKAMMGIGESAGMDRARIAAEQAVASPLLDGVDLNGARGVIVNITAAHNLKLRETNEVINTIREFCSEDATIIHGTVFDDNMKRIDAAASKLNEAADATIDNDMRIKLTVDFCKKWAIKLIQTIKDADEGLSLKDFINITDLFECTNFFIQVMVPLIYFFLYCQHV